MTCCGSKNILNQNRIHKVSILKKIDIGNKDFNKNNGEDQYSILFQEWCAIKTIKPTDMIDENSNIFLIKTHLFYFKYNSNTKLITKANYIEYNNIKYLIDGVENVNENKAEIRVYAHIKNENKN